MIPFFFGFITEDDKKERHHSKATVEGIGPTRNPPTEKCQIEERPVLLISKTQPGVEVLNSSASMRTGLVLLRCVVLS